MYKAMPLALALVSTAPAYAAQLDVDIVDGDIEPKFGFLRVINIDYSHGGQLPELMPESRQEISFSMDSSRDDVSSAVALLQQSMREELSTAVVEDIKIEYRASLSPNDKSATIEYRILLVPTLSGAARSDIVDFQWRGFSIEGPVLVETRHGTYDINDPASAIRVIAPGVAGMLEPTGASDVLSLPLLDASGLRKPLESWHYLFDPIGKQLPGMAVSDVISQYSMGQCGIIGFEICQDKHWESEVELDQKYVISATESQDDATVTPIGYTTVSSIRGIDYIERIPEAVTGPVEDLSVHMIYGMAIVAAVAGGSFFAISSRKTKKEDGMGQTGIDPANLVAYQTSSSAGSYRTNRGESVLRSTDSKSAV